MVDGCCPLRDDYAARFLYGIGTALSLFWFVALKDEKHFVENHDWPQPVTRSYIRVQINNYSNRRPYKKTETEKDTEFNVETRTGKNQAEFTNSEIEHYDKESTMRNSQATSRSPSSTDGCGVTLTLSLSLSLAHSYGYTGNDLFYAILQKTHHQY